MKKHRKLVALLIALTFLFSVVAPAMAADESKAEMAADKLNGLGIIEGYPDGTFGLDRNITRAEFAKVAVIAAGLKEAAEQLVNFPSQFSDVATGEWYTGWINMAASQGYVKGDPAGTFRPNDEITYAEVVTVLVRLLGYNDNLTGPWPTNYLAKAVELDITKGVAINASAPAVRGDVFIMTNNTLDCELVEWSTDKLGWEEKTGKKLIVKSFKGNLYKGLVKDISWDNKGRIILDILGYDDAPSGNMRVADNVIVTGAEDPFGLFGSNVEFIRNEKAAGADENTIVYLGRIDTDVVSKDKAEIDSSSSGSPQVASKVKIDNKTYDVASGWGYTVFPEGTYAWDGQEKADKVTIVLNDEGKAQWGFVYKYVSGDVLEEIDGDSIYGFAGESYTKKSSDKVVVIRNGAIVDFEDLQEGDLFYVVTGDNVHGLNALIIASDESITGTLDEYSTDDKKIVIDGTKYDLAAGYLVSDNEGKNFKASLSKDMVNEDVTVMLSPAGKAAVVVSGAKSTSDELYGIVDKVGTNTFDSNRIRIFTAEGKLVNYEVTKEIEKKIENADIDVAAGELVEYKLNKDGKISSLVKVDNGETTSGKFRSNGFQVQTGKWYTITDKTVYFANKDQSGTEWTVVSWEEFKDALNNQSGKDIIFKLDNNNRVKAVYAKTQLSSGVQYGVIAGRGTDRDGDFVDVYIGGEGGEKQRIHVKGQLPTQYTSLASKDVIEFTMTSGKIDLATVTKYTYSSTDVKYGQVTATGSGYITVDTRSWTGGRENKEPFDIDSNTAIVDITGSTVVDKARIARDAWVMIVDTPDSKKDGVYKLIVICGKKHQ